MKSTRFLFSALLLTTMSMLNACIESEEPYDYFGTLKKDMQTIDDYLDANGLFAVEDPRGIRMVITKMGTGMPAMITNKVKVGYVGKVLGSSTPFETGTASGGQVGNYIPGWQLALTTLPLGSKASVYIPSPLAYSNQQQGAIPPNSILVFDIDFQDIEETETERQQLKSDTTAIDAFLAENDIIDVAKDTTGIRYRITNEGTPGPKPFWYAPVKFSAKYKLFNDVNKVVFEQTLEPNESYPGRVVDQIHALKFMLQNLNEGGKAIMYVPSSMAFGPQSVRTPDNSATAIPANSNVIIEVELLDIL